jgi:hypothetical protein
MILSASIFAISFDSLIILDLISFASFKILSFSINASLRIFLLSACANSISERAFSADFKASLMEVSLSFIVSKIGFHANFFNKKIKPTNTSKCQKKVQMKIH